MSPKEGRVVFRGNFKTLQGRAMGFGFFKKILPKNIFFQKIFPNMAIRLEPRLAPNIHHPQCPPHAWGRIRARPFCTFLEMGTAHTVWSIQYIVRTGVWRMPMPMPIPTRARVPRGRPSAGLWESLGGSGSPASSIVGGAGAAPLSPNIHAAARRRCSTLV